MDKIDRKGLEEILAKHAKHTDDKIEGLTKNTDYKLEIISDDISTIKENISHLTERMDHMTGRMDDMTGRMDGMTERMDNMTERMDHMTEKVDVIFEQTGQLTVDMEIVKESVQRHEQKIGRL
ncbi:MAG: hypothetical protein U1C49_01765 [Candidatus Andersenbacteria bacterium]|nr:hypothetical protein [bacterium]MDZ4225553.1 hypothetical protein [Candidatus Andersenbacteria bacterium]